MRLHILLIQIQSQIILIYFILPANKCMCRMHQYIEFIIPFQMNTNSQGGKKENIEVIYNSTIHKNKSNKLKFYAWKKL